MATSDYQRNIATTTAISDLANLMTLLDQTRERLIEAATSEEANWSNTGDLARMRTALIDALAIAEGVETADIIAAVMEMS